MRQKRTKAYRKLMSLYSLTYGFRQPYQVLIDAEMCKEAVAHKIELFKQLSVVLQGEIKPMITQCCIHELYLQGRSQQPAVDLAKSCERRRCNHREAIPGEECLASVVGDTNKHRYIIATQSQSLRARFRSIPGIPIVHVNRSVMILEPASDATLKAKATTEEQALHPKAPDMALMGPSKPEEPARKKRKGPKGPNPLSVRKKVKVTNPKPTHATVETPKVARKRQRDEDGDDNSGVETRLTSHESRKRKRRRTKSLKPASAMSS